MNVVQRIIQEEIRKLNESLIKENNKFKTDLEKDLKDNLEKNLKNNLKEKKKNLKDINIKLDQMRIKAEADRPQAGGTRAGQDVSKLAAFVSKITPVPPQDQLTVLERDQLDFFVKSPGIGMLFLSTAFYLAKTDLGGQLESAADETLQSEINELSDQLRELAEKLQSELNELGSKLESAAAKALRSEVDELKSAAVNAYKLGTEVKVLRESNPVLKTVSLRLLKPARVCLTIVMPLLLLGVQFAYIFFIFKEGYDNYNAGVCPGYDVPDKIRHDPGIGADTQVRILVGFIGGYFVFKNISQLILYQRALRGNTELDNDLESKVSTKLDLQSKVLKAAGIMVKVVSAVESAATGLPVNDPETVGDDPKTVSSSGQDEKSKEKTADTRLLMPRLG